MRNSRPLGLELIALGAVIATAAALGPFAAGVIHYRTSASGINQISGGDAVALIIVAPACLAAGVLALRNHPAAPALALGPAVFAAYTYTQLIAGEEYGTLPGNNERYFPLLYAGFLLSVIITVTAWRAATSAALPAPTPRSRRIAAATLFAVVLLLAAQHLPTLADALRGTTAGSGHQSSPTAFWLVKLMDLGLVAPAAIATGAGLLRRSAEALVPAYAIVGAYALLGASVTGMAVVMLAHGDPDASAPFAAGFAILSLTFFCLASALYRPLFAATRSFSTLADPDAGTPAGTAAQGRAVKLP